MLGCTGRPRLVDERKKDYFLKLTVYLCSLFTKFASDKNMSHVCMMCGNVGSGGRKMLGIVSLKLGRQDRVLGRGDCFHLEAQQSVQLHGTVQNKYFYLFSLCNCTGIECALQAVSFSNIQITTMYVLDYERWTFIYIH